MEFLDPSSRGIRAKENFYQGYNCAQSVFLAFSDLTGYEKEDALRLASPFGAGMGRMREVCGALTGALMVVGILYGYDTDGSDGSKKKLYSDVQALFDRFAEENGSFLCCELLGVERKSQDPTPAVRDRAYYDSRPCPVIVERAAEMLTRFLTDHPIDA